MTAYIILGIVLGLPLFLGLFLRVNTSFLFFSLLAGELLGRYFGHEAELVLRLVIRNERVIQYAELIVLVLPVVLTALFLRHTLTKGKAILHVIPLLITGFVFAAFVLPILPEADQAHVRTIPAGQRLLEGSDRIVGATVFLQLVSLWLTNKPHEKHAGKKHHK